jgi:hypothetical protein
MVGPKSLTAFQLFARRSWMTFKIFLTVPLTTMLILSAGCASKSNNSGAGPVPTGKMGTGLIQGKVILTGKIPDPVMIRMDADPLCRAQHPGPMPDESVVADAKGDLANVLVYVQDGAAVYAPPSTPVTLIQQGCRYSPHVFGVQTRQSIEIFNHDPTLHNVHAMAVTNDGFNVGQTQDAKSEKSFSQPEVPIKIRCDIHGWMKCYLGVFDHPFFSVTGKDGAFKITGLPAGAYTLVAWQETYGFSSPQKVNVQEGQTQTINFTFSAP